jgi:hypothetical protein
LNGQIIGFHKSRRIPLRFGRPVWRSHQHFYRWCFSDLATARAFVGQFGGAFYKILQLENCGLDKVVSRKTKIGGLLALFVGLGNY